MPIIGGNTGGGAGSVTLIGKTVLGASSASISVGSIPSTYSSLFVTMLLRSTRAVSSESAFVQLNADATAANYFTERQLNNKGSALTSEFTASAGFNVDAIGANVTAGFFTGCFMYLHGYASTSYVTMMNGEAMLFDGTGGLQESIGGVWTPTTVVTSITVVPSVGPNLLTGTSLFVYGLAAA